MTDHDTPTAPTLDGRLDAWANSERSRLVEPAPQFLRRVRAARPRRIMPRIIEACVLAAGLALVAYVLSTADSERRPGPDPDAGTPVATIPPARAFSIGTGRGADVADVFDLLDSMPQRPAPESPPTRASDAYCAGCLDELTRI